MDSAPYLSVVATARNDDHGGHLLRRMQIFVNGLLEQCRRHSLPAELILVEWNPPADKPRLAEALSWPRGSPCRVRIIQVPNEIHRRYVHAEALPLYQMIAKNVGIRRAAGQFVLATNIDILFSDALMAFLAARQLDGRRMYRIDRHDVAADVPLESPLDQQLHYCRTHVLRTHQRYRTVQANPYVIKELQARVVTLWHLEKRVMAQLLDGARSALGRRSPLPRAGDPASLVAAEIPKPEFDQPPKILYPLNFYLAAIEKVGRTINQFFYECPGTRPPLHTNACGDFTLMGRHAWSSLRGYAELDMYSWHLDSVLCHCAAQAGIREYWLGGPMQIYHIEHGIGSGWTPEGAEHLKHRLARAKIPQLTDAQFRACIRAMRRQGKPILFNETDWGLAADELPETVEGISRCPPS